MQLGTLEAGDLWTLAAAVLPPQFLIIVSLYKLEVDGKF